MNSLSKFINIAILLMRLAQEGFPYLFSSGLTNLVSNYKGFSERLRNHRNLSSFLEHCVVAEYTMQLQIW